MGKKSLQITSYNASGANTRGTALPTSGYMKFSSNENGFKNVSATEIVNEADPNKISWLNNLNDIHESLINETNTIGQVLTITSTDPKQVAFQDTQGGLPPTSEQPSGYVLGILDPILGILEWKQDAQGSIPDPLVLSGTDSVNKFQVRNDTNNPRFTIDTVNNKVKVQEAELQVNRTGIPLFTVGDASGVSMRNAGGTAYATFNYSDETLTISGQNYKSKFSILDNDDKVRFKVDTTNSETYVSENFVVANNAGGDIFSIVATNKVVNLNIIDTTKNGSIKFLDTAETLPIGIPSTTNMKLNYDAGGVGDTDFVGYISRNGPNAMYNLVNNLSTELFLVAPNAGIQTTAEIMTISSSDVSGRCALQFNTSISLEAGGNSYALNVDSSGATANCPISSIVDNGLNHEGGLITQNTVSGGGRVEVLASYQSGVENKILSTGGAGLLVNSEGRTTIVTDTDMFVHSGDALYLGRQSAIGPGTPITDIYSSNEMSLSSNVIYILASTEVSVSGPCNFVNIPTTSVVPVNNIDITNKLYVDTLVSGPRSVLNALTYVNDLSEGGVLPSVPTTTAQVAFNLFNWTGATLITPTPSGFTVVSPGVWQYTGTGIRVFNFNIDIAVVSAAADQLVQIVLVDDNDAVIQPTLSQFYTFTLYKNGGTSINLSLALNTNDIVKVAVRTPREATTLTIENYKFQIMEN